MTGRAEEMVACSVFDGECGRGRQQDLTVKSIQGSDLISKKRDLWSDTMTSRIRGGWI